MKKLIAVVIVVMGIVGIIYLWLARSEVDQYRYPLYEQISLDGMLEDLRKGIPATKEIKETLSLQTGMSVESVENFLEERYYDIFLAAQEKYYTIPEIETIQASGVVYIEKIVAEQVEDFEGKFVDLEKGDILLTFNARILGWRSGHIGIVVDPEEGLVLEAVELGVSSTIQSIRSWEEFPQVQVLRLKDASQELRNEIAEYASACFVGIEYGFYEDVMEHFLVSSSLVDSHCAHMIWQIFMSYGYNLDSNGGIFVTPEDISKSDYLYTVQSFGI